jgi:hypothetical protein
VPEQHHIHELAAEVGAAWRGGDSTTSVLRRRRRTGTAAKAAANIAFKLQSKRSRSRVNKEIKKDVYFETESRIFTYVCDNKKNARSE